MDFLFPTFSYAIWNTLIGVTAVREGVAVLMTIRVIILECCSGVTNMCANSRKSSWMNIHFKQILMLHPGSIFTKTVPLHSYTLLWSGHHHQWSAPSETEGGSVCLISWALVWPMAYVIHFLFMIFITLLSNCSKEFMKRYWWWISFLSSFVNMSCDTQSAFQGCSECLEWPDEST